MAENLQRPYKRRHYFINRRLQGRFTIYFLILGLFITVSASMLIWHFSAKGFDRFIYRSHLPPITPWEIVFPVMIKDSGYIHSSARYLGIFICSSHI